MQHTDCNIKNLTLIPSFYNLTVINLIIYELLCITNPVLPACFYLLCCKDIRQLQESGVREYLFTPAKVKLLKEESNESFKRHQRESPRCKNSFSHSNSGKQPNPWIFYPKSCIGYTL